MTTDESSAVASVDRTPRADSPTKTDPETADKRRKNPSKPAADVDKSADMASNRALYRLIAKTVAGVIALILVVGALGVYLREPITALAITAIDTLGLAGVFLGVFASDSIGFPVPPTTYLFAAVASGSPMLSIWLVTSVASILGAIVAFHIGPYMARLPILKGTIDRFRQRGKKLFARWGIWTVGIAAVTPLPFPIICWLAGIYEMSFRRFFWTILIRAPRFAAYYGAFVLGWTGSEMI